MTIEEIKQKVASKEYNFLRENEDLGKNIILLGIGGSHAYGTNTESSDLDVRGIATNKKRKSYQIFILNILLMKKWIRQFILLTK